MNFYSSTKQADFIGPNDIEKHIKSKIQLVSMVYE